MIEKKVTDCFLGRALSISDGKTELKVTLDVGPRIISLSKVGGENIFYEDKEEKITKDVSALYGKGRVWRLYGGHRIWISPEDDTTYVPDDQKVKYALTERGAEFIPSPWKEKGAQTALGVTFLSDGKIKVTMEIKNISQKTKLMSLWSLTVMRPGGVMRAALDTTDTGYSMNRNLVLWSYSDVKDPRLSIENGLLSVRSDPAVEKPFKIGTCLKKLSAEYELDGVKFIKTVEETGKAYPDCQSNLETYTNNIIHEIETLSPVAVLPPDQSVTHTEIWELR
jgi:hypothetical protein